MRRDPSWPRTTSTGWAWDADATYGRNSFDPPPSRAYDRVATGVRATESYALTGRAGSLAVQRTLVAPWSAVGAAIARCAANPLCAGASIALPLALDYARARYDAERGLVRDPGADQEVGQVLRFSSGTPGNQDGYATGWIASSMSSLCAHQVTLANGWAPGAGPWVCTHSAAPAPGTCSGTLSIWSDYAQTGYNRVVCAENINENRCPASTDPSNPAYNVPAGLPPGPDGRCATARYNHVPTTPPAIGDWYGNYPPAEGTPGNNARDGFRDAMSGGETAPGSIPGATTGPASQTGNPTTTTTSGPSGTETQTRTPTYNYTYSPTTINYTTTITTVTNNNGQTTTTEEQVPEQPLEELCERNPEILACQRLGDMPTDQVPRETRNIDYSPEAVSLPSGCPADVPLVRGEVYSYATACNTAINIRPLVLAVAAFGAAMIGVAALRSA